MGLDSLQLSLHILAPWNSTQVAIMPLLYGRLCGWLGSLRVAHRLALYWLSHRDAGLWVLLPLLS